jgi:hypothetical protein
VIGHLHDPAALPPGEETPIPTEQEGGWAPESVRILGKPERLTGYQDSQEGPM